MHQVGCKARQAPCLEVGVARLGRASGGFERNSETSPPAPVPRREARRRLVAIDCLGGAPGAVEQRAGKALEVGAALPGGAVLLEDFQCRCRLVAFDLQAGKG